MPVPGLRRTMIKKYSREWEKVSHMFTRLRVPGGWVVNAWNEDNDFLCFVPDADHQWVLEDEQ